MRIQKGPPGRQQGQGLMLGQRGVPIWPPTSVGRPKPRSCLNAAAVRRERCSDQSTQLLGVSGGLVWREVCPLFGGRDRAQRWVWRESANMAADLRR